MKCWIPLLAIAALFALSSANADELRLKDGTKIVGTIVGFEENSFKVKTSYGFAVVQKDQVASINISGDAKPAPAAKTDSAPSVEAPKATGAAKASPASVAATALPAAPPAITKLPSSSKTATAEKSPPAAAPVQTTVEVKPPKSEAPRASIAPVPPKTPDKAGAPVPAPVPEKRTDAAISSSAKPPAAVSAPESHPAAAPAAEIEPIRERVLGNTYTNETFGFQMYKPPTWEVIAGVPSLLPGAIAAMGTNDQTTYLLVGQEAAGKSPSAMRDATQRRLRDIMDNFRPLGETAITVSGAPATEIRFRGGVDEHDWSGVAVFVAHGPRLFTIFGMTLADSDLVQIQENVIARAISSLQFTKQ